METKEQKKERIDRVLKEINIILEREQCELEPSVVVLSGVIVKKETNVVTRPLKTTLKAEEGGVN